MNGYEKYLTEVKITKEHLIKYSVTAFVTYSISTRSTYYSMNVQKEPCNCQHAITWKTLEAAYFAKEGKFIFNEQGNTTSHY